MAEVEAASVLAMMGVFDFVGTIGSGWLSDRYDNRKLLFWYYGLRGLSLLFLPMSTLHVLRPVALRGVLRARLDRDGAADREAGRRAPSAARRRRWSSAGSSPAHQLGAAIAALGGGLSRDALASYLPAFYLAGAACLLAAVLALGARARPRPAPVAA